MKRIFLLNLSIALVVCASSVAEAKVWFGPALGYITDSTDDGSSESEQTRTLMDVRLGALGIGGSSFYLGGVYSSDSTDYGTGDATITALGVSAGFMPGNGFGIIFHYYLQAAYDVGTVLEGTGMGLDFFYHFKISGSGGLGPMFKYYSYTFTKDEDGNELPDDYTKSGIAPYISLGFEF